MSASFEDLGSRHWSDFPTAAHEIAKGNVDDLDLADDPIEGEIQTTIIQMKG